MKRKLFDITLSATAALLLLSMGLGVWLLPSPDFSEEENRALATLSLPSPSKIADGSFSEELGEFFRDRAPLRLSFIRLRAISELFLMKGEVNGVLFCRDGYLIDRGEYDSLATAQKNADELFALSELLKDRGVPTETVFVPRGIDVMTEKLPPLYEGNNEAVFSLVLTEGHSARLLSSLRSAAENGEYVWFKTDHHWTARGAYIAYTELASALGYTPYGEDFFSVQTVSRDFLGSLYSRAGCIAPSADSVELFRYVGDADYLLSADGKEYSGLYFYDFLEKKDVYSVFLGGNYARLSIKKEGNAPRQRLLLIKDSYSNALVPFLALHFDLELIDPRYYSSLEELSEDIPPADQALILYGLETVAT